MMWKFFELFSHKIYTYFRSLSGKLLIVSAGQYPSTVVRVGDVRWHRITLPADER